MTYGLTIVMFALSVTIAASAHAKEVSHKKIVHIDFSQEEDRAPASVVEEKETTEARIRLVERIAEIAKAEIPE